MTDDATVKELRGEIHERAMEIMRDYNAKWDDWAAYECARREAAELVAIEKAGE